MVDRTGPPGNVVVVAPSLDHLRPLDKDVVVISRDHDTIRSSRHTNQVMALDQEIEPVTRQLEFFMPSGNNDRLAPAAHREGKKKYQVEQPVTHGRATSSNGNSVLRAGSAPGD